MPAGGDILTKTVATPASGDHVFGMQSGAVVRFLNAASLKLTYTGTPQTALVFPVTMASIAVVPVAAVGGQATYSAVVGPSIFKFTYTELNLATQNKLTTLSFDDLVGVVDNLSPTQLSSLTTLSCPALVAVGGNCSPTSMAALTSLSLPALANVGGSVSPQLAALTSLSLPSLVSIGINFNPSNLTSLTSLSCPVLSFIGGTIAVSTANSLATFVLDALTRVSSSVSLSGMSSLTTVSFAAIVSYGSTITMNSSLGNLANVTLGTIGTLKNIDGATINISGQKLTEATVNAILALLVSLDGTNGTTLWGSGKTLNVSGGTSSAPTGQGITDKATLQARGATITSN